MPPLSINSEKEYLKTKDQADLGLTAKECTFCHIENANKAMVKVIEEQGFYIVEMENCN